MELTLDALIDAAKADNPADALTTAFADANATREQVETLRTEAITRFGEVRGKDELTADDMDVLNILAEVSDAAAGELGRIGEAEAEMQSRLDALDSRMSTDSDTPDVEDPEVEVEAPAADAIPEPAAAAAAPPVPPKKDDDEDEEDDKKTPPMTASARRVVLSQLQSQAPTPLPTEEKGVAIVAAADVRGFSTGQDIPDLDKLAEAAASKFAAMPKNMSVPGVRTQAGIAQLRVAYPDDLKAHDDGGSDVRAIERSIDVKGRTGKSLVAAGGWCAPSEVIYELSPGLESATSGLIDLPSIAVTRGGIRTPNNPDYSSVFSGNIGLVQTETQASSATPADYTKATYRIPCVGFSETRADVIYTIIEAGILQADAYPEQNRRHVEIALAVHAHKINASSIARIDAASTAVSASAFGPSATASLLNSLGLLIKHAQYKYRAQPTLMMEVILPEYTREIVRADYALRSGIPLENVTDAQIDGWFSSRNAKVQWVYDWQDAYTGVTGSAAIGGATAPTVYPTSVNALVYPEGTFVRGRGDVVNLDAIYDSTNVKVNDFLQLMVEEKLLVHKRAHTSFKLTVPLAVNGATSAPIELDGNGKKVV